MYLLILIDVLLYIYMNNNNNYQCKMCWNKALTFGVGSIKLSFCTIVFTQYTCKNVFNPNVITFQSNCAKGLHFSAFHYHCTIILSPIQHSSICFLIINHFKHNSNSINSNNNNNNNNNNNINNNCNNEKH